MESLSLRKRVASVIIVAIGLTFTPLYLIMGVVGVVPISVITGFTSVGPLLWSLNMLLGFKQVREDFCLHAKVYLFLAFLFWIGLLLLYTAWLR